MSNTYKRFSYKTKTEYEYSLKEPIVTEELANLLEEAPKYNRVKFSKINQQYMDYLELELKLFATDGSDGEAYFYYKMQQGILNILHNEDSVFPYTIVLFASEDSIEEEIYNDIFRREFSVGLERLLDTNYGGNLNENTVSLANLIVFG